MKSISDQSHLLFKDIKHTYRHIYIILAVPRSSSTAFSRVFWEHRAIGFYCHEPFDCIYYKQLSLPVVKNVLMQPLNLNQLQEIKNGKDLLIKEMTFQVGAYFQHLASLTTKPILFIIRNPKQNILSRMKKREEGGQDPFFPFIESGWRDVEAQVQFCKEYSVPYLIVDTSTFRNEPKSTFRQIFNQIGLRFSEDLFTWTPAEHIRLGNLGGEQTHWYEQVLGSSRLLPDDEAIPEIDEFPDFWQEHILECMEIYHRLRSDEKAICEMVLAMPG